MRYALYLLPEPDTPLWHRASSLIGYDAAQGCSLAQPVLEGVAPEALVRATEDPRRYGFHLTLKAPFRLADGYRETQLITAVEAFCCSRSAFDTGVLTFEARAQPQGTGFVCLVPQAVCPALFALEQACVRDFDLFRAPLNPQEIARRRPERLTARQRAHLEAFGYPFVLDEFRPHFSLTGEVENPQDWCTAIGAWFAARKVPLDCKITGIGLFRQETPEDRFRLIKLARFGHPTG